MLNPIILSLQNVTKVTSISKGLIFRRNVTKRKGPKNRGPFFQWNDRNKCNKGRSNVKPYHPKPTNVTKVARISKGLIFRRNVTKRKGLKKWGHLFLWNDRNKCNKGRSNVKPYHPKPTKCNQSNKDF